MRRAVVLCCLLLGCGGPGALEGSLSEQVDLSYDAIELQRSDTALAVVFTRAPSGGGKDVVLKVTAATKAVGLTRAVTIDLAELVDGAARGAVSRAVTGDARRDFPVIKRGTITLEDAPVVGAAVAGDVDILFEQGGALGSGRTVFGSFHAVVTEAGR